MPLCSSFSSSWVPGLAFEEVYRLIKLDHYLPGVFNLGREVYKCNSRFNFLRVTSEGQRIKDFRVRRSKKGTGRCVAPVLPRVGSCLAHTPECILSPCAPQWGRDKLVFDQAWGKGLVHSSHHHDPWALHLT